ncbi:MAG: hypothetical protein A07HR60_00626 [uncultured archaeon A07HR60]|nr:MAG: hypothetical protein A07HR60_00626 [uncultured archaeon A07HR60]
MSDTPLKIEYDTHPRVKHLIDRLKYTMEGISLGFDSYGEPNVKGPGLYFAIVADISVSDFADVMGANYWPSRGRDPVTDPETFHEAAGVAAHDRDGATVVSVDGLIKRQFVRFRSLTQTDRETAGLPDGIGYEPWMGSRHMSALDTSVREPVVATLTLSEETGRVSLFRDGRVDTTVRSELGGEWRADGE